MMKTLCNGLLLSPSPKKKHLFIGIKKSLDEQSWKKFFFGLVFMYVFSHIEAQMASH